MDEGLQRAPESNQPTDPVTSWALLLFCKEEHPQWWQCSRCCCFWGLLATPQAPPASGALQAAPLLLLTFSPSHLQAARNLGFPSWVTCKEKERRVPLGRHPEKQEPKCADFSAGAPATIETFYLFSEHDIFQWVCIKQNSCWYLPTGRFVTKQSQTAQALFNLDIENSWLSSSHIASE